MIDNESPQSKTKASLPYSPGREALVKGGLTNPEYVP